MVRQRAKKIKAFIIRPNRSILIWTVTENMVIVCLILQDPRIKNHL